MSAEEEKREEQGGVPENELGAEPAFEAGAGPALVPNAGEACSLGQGLLEDDRAEEVWLDSEVGVSTGLESGEEDEQAGEETLADEDALSATAAPVAAGSRLKGIVEALIFCSESPLSLERMVALVDSADRKEVKRAVEELVQEYRDRPGGLEIVEVAGGFQVRTRPEFAVWVAKLRQQKPARLSRAALEAVAIVAYRQPVTRAEIEAIRGVDCAAAIGSLLEKKLIRIVGRKEVPGRPILYGTTQEFLELFGLKNLKSLPTLREIEGMFVEAKPEDEKQPELEAVPEPPEVADPGREETQPSQQPDVDAGRAGEGQEEEPITMPAEDEEGEEEEGITGGERESLDDVALKKAMDDVLRKTKIRFVRYEDVYQKEAEAEGKGEAEGKVVGALRSPDAPGTSGKETGGDGSTGSGR